MKRRNVTFIFLVFNVLTLSSCSTLNSNNNFDYLSESSGCINYFWESFGVEYPKNNVDKANDFNICHSGKFILSK